MRQSTSMERARKGAAAQQLGDVGALVRELGERLKEFVVKLLVDRVARPAEGRNIVELVVVANREAREHRHAPEDLGDALLERCFGPAAWGGFHDSHFAARLS